MNLFNRIKIFFKRRKYIRFTSFSSAPSQEIFTAIREGLEHCLELVAKGEHQPDVGICFNAGFMGTGARHRFAGSVFLEMLREYNLQVRKVDPKAPFSIGFPFSDIDGILETPNLWSGFAGCTRRDAIHWALGEIEKCELDTR